MKPAPEKMANLTLEIPNRSLAQSLLRRWTDDSGLLVTIRRGRISEHEARFELEIRGSAANIAKVVHQSAPWDSSRRSLNRVPTAALA